MSTGRPSSLTEGGSLIEIALKLGLTLFPELYLSREERWCLVPKWFYKSFTEIQKGEREMKETAAKAKEDTKGKGYYSFRFRSTGLGEQMLMGEPLQFLVIDDMLVFQIQTTEPVQWVIRAGFTYRGVLKAIKLALKPSVIKFLLFGFKSIKNPELTDDF